MMRKIVTVAIASVWLVSCMSESGVSPGNSSTFIRYFNGGNNDAAQAIEETPDKGFIILANTRIQKAEADIPHTKIKLIKTDANGNPVWTKLFPDINTNTLDYTASGIQLLTGGGYVITGDDIQNIQTGDSKCLLLTIDDSGNLVKSASYGSTVKGKAVATNAQGDFLILSITGPETMYLAEISKTTFQPVNPSQPVITYSAGQTSLANKLFVDGTGKALWSGVVTKNGLTGIRMIKTIPNNVNTEFDLLISSPGYSEVGTDFCKYGFGYAITGSTDQKKDANGNSSKGSDTDILFKLLADDGTVLSTKSFPFGDGVTPDGQNDIGNSISSTQDGGLILLASVNSTAIKGNGDTDYYLIKINAFGDKDVSFGTAGGSSFGSRYKDDGVAVRQVSDGGYIVLGTTTQGGLKLITLMKTNKSGKIE